MIPRLNSTKFQVGIRQSAQIPPDIRAYSQALLSSLPSQLLIPYLYPTLYSLHNMPAEAGTIGEQGVVLPPALPLTSERLERHGLFLIEDGQTIFLWVGRDAVPQLVQDVFDLSNYESLRGGKVRFFPAPRRNKLTFLFLCFYRRLCIPLKTRSQNESMPSSKRFARCAEVFTTRICILSRMMVNPLSVCGL